MIHSSSTAAAALLGITALVGVVAGNRCFVCLPRLESWRNDAMKLFPAPSELLLCEHFNPKDKRYERECPARYTGCLTQTREPHVLRTCSDGGEDINDCKVANGIRYCFCSGRDLCNGDTKPTGHPVSRSTTEYDEDEPTDGSGDDSSPKKPNSRPTTAHPPHGTTTTNFSPSRGSAMISRTLGLLPVMAALATATAQ